MIRTSLKIDGMMCEKCEAHISDVIRKTIPNAKKVSASRTKGQATFISDEKPDKDALSEGYWKSYFNSIGSAYALPDSDYRQLLKFKAALNVMPSTMKGMDEALYSVFGDNVTIQNNQDLSITYVINQQTVVTQAAEILGYFTGPMGITVNFSYGSST